MFLRMKKQRYGWRKSVDDFVRQDGNRARNSLKRRAANGKRPGLLLVFLSLSPGVLSLVRPAAILENFEWPYLRKGSFDPLI